MSIAVHELLDRLIGADRLRPGQRAEFRAQQLRSIVDQTPLMVAGNMALAVILVIIYRNSPLIWELLAWLPAIATMMALAMRNWLKTRKLTVLTASRRSISKAAIHAFIAGSLWGWVAAYVNPNSPIELQVMTELALVGMLGGSLFALANVPQASLAFAAPLVFGAYVGLAQMPPAVHPGAIAILLTVFVVILVMSTLTIARRFVGHYASETMVREQNNIISLFLREFEENSSDWLWEIDAGGVIERASDRFAAALDCPRDSLVGKEFCGLLEDFGCDPVGADRVRAIMQERKTLREMILRFDTPSGERWWRISGKPVLDSLGKFTGYVGTGSDISSEKIAENRINFLAHNDPLTGLMNRTRFTEMLKQSVARLERYGAPFTVLYLDLDHFKLVNDTRGHLAGDQLLVEVSQRIRSVVREGDSVARLGGDEFSILLNNNGNAHETAVLASRIVEAVRQPFVIEGESVSIGVSIGIAIAPMNGTRPDQLLRNADLALYRAKEEGKGVFRFFESQMDSNVRERRMLELELQEALAENQLLLSYQPLVSADGQRPGGFEALLRWNHPIRGMVPPVEFIPIAEQSSLICQIGDWTIREACRAASKWPGDMFVAVNLSARHFQTSDIAAVVAEALRESGLPARNLELEITESLLIDRTDEVIAKLAQVQALGVTIALDDFGTGYSSLSYLMKFPFNKIKIDKSFVTASGTDGVARDILRTISALGEALNIQITAEGVETPEQVEFLRGIACHQLQGYLFAKPLNERDLSSYLLTKFADGVRNGKGDVDDDGAPALGAVA